MTKAERQHLDRVAALGCLCCALEGHPDTPALIHHIRAGQGLSQRASHYDTLPLCELHHVGTDSHYPSIHRAKRAFEARYGTERELLERVRALLNT